MPETNFFCAQQYLVRHKN